ncbi:hypothetical protein F4821DRAFT_229241 [Hypoxylon rubiginosum]|uniref:Uncharacterized protein n=1 Tax=Hypoxylon rubiginosum TaxID=110542 RepID=A0ACC0DCV4_9PEZI|nr:hypothetical protein F4821DRAFT_229241 [Hypoxylon rubiginosum]
MSAQPTSPQPFDVAADQPKDRTEPLLDAQPTSQDAHHSDPVKPVKPVTVATQSPGDRDSAVAQEPSTTTESPLQSPESQKSPAQEQDHESSLESGEASPVSSPIKSTTAGEPSAPPLPNEPPPAIEDDGWDFHWDATNQAYFFYNRFTHETTWENPRLATQASSSSNQPTQAPGTEAPTAVATAPGVAEPPKNERPPAGGYNPAIHGDYDPNAWYAQGNKEDEASAPGQAVDATTAAAYAAAGSFNRFTGRWQGADQNNPERYTDESKSRRQMNAFFDVDAAANSHDGRSLKAERSGKKPTKAELKQFKEKRRAKKEEKRRAWLRD